MEYKNLVEPAVDLRAHWYTHSKNVKNVTLLEIINKVMELTDEKGVKFVPFETVTEVKIKDVIGKGSENIQIMSEVTGKLEQDEQPKVFIFSFYMFAKGLCMEDINYRFLISGLCLVETRA